MSVPYKLPGNRSKMPRRDTVRRGGVNDIWFETDDVVRVRISPSEFAVGRIVAKPTISQPLYQVDVDGKIVDASWFHINHHHPE